MDTFFKGRQENFTWIACLAGTLGKGVKANYNLRVIFSSTDYCTGLKS
jgi:hypothetical protein